MNTHLDALRGSDNKALMNAWNALRYATRKEAAEIVGGKPPGYTLVPRKLAAYACNKATMITCEERGDATAASIYRRAARMCLEDVPVAVRARLGLTVTKIKAFNP